MSERERMEVANGIHNFISKDCMIHFGAHPKWKKEKEVNGEELMDLIEKYLMVRALPNVLFVSLLPSLSLTHTHRISLISFLSLADFYLSVNCMTPTSCHTKQRMKACTRRSVHYRAS